jgi:hypothetical protein
LVVFDQKARPPGVNPEASGRLEDGLHGATAAVVMSHLAERQVDLQRVVELALLVACVWPGVVTRPDAAVNVEWLVAERDSVVGMQHRVLTLLGVEGPEGDGVELVLGGPLNEAVHAAGEALELVLELGELASERGHAAKGLLAAWHLGLSFPLDGL